MQNFSVSLCVILPSPSPFVYLTPLPSPPPRSHAVCARLVLFNMLILLSPAAASLFTHTQLCAHTHTHACRPHKCLYTHTRDAPSSVPLFFCVRVAGRLWRRGVGWLGKGGWEKKKEEKNLETYIHKIYIWLFYVWKHPKLNGSIAGRTEGRLPGIIDAWQCGLNLLFTHVCVCVCASLCVCVRVGRFCGRETTQHSRKQLLLLL